MGTNRSLGIAVVVCVAVFASSAFIDVGPRRVAGRPSAYPGPTPTPEQRQGRYVFADMTRALGVAGEPQRTWGLVWADHDGDGDADILIGNHWQPATLYLAEGDGYRYTSPPALARQGIDRHSCLWGEANGDRLPDLYCVVGADMGTGSGPNQLLLQDAGGGLHDAARAYGVRDRFGRGRTAQWLDYDGDGDLDLFVGNAQRRGHPNRLFRNDRGSFTPVGAGLAAEHATVGSSWADYDRDSDPDLLLLRERPASGILYRNTEGRFAPVRVPQISQRAWISGTWGDFNADGWPDLALVGRRRLAIMKNTAGRLSLVRSMRLRQGSMAVWLDVENDGDLDLFVVQGARGADRQPVEGSRNYADFFVLKRGARHERLEGIAFEEPSFGSGQAVAVADGNGDGRLDLFVTNGNYYWRGTNVYIENRARAGNFVGIRLDGTRWNPWGYGATVRVRAGTRIWRRAVTDGFSFQSQSDPAYVHFGIGDASRARLRVTWPDGAADCLSLDAGEVATVGKGRFGCP